MGRQGTGSTRAAGQRVARHANDAIQSGMDSLGNGNRCTAHWHRITLSLSPVHVRLVLGIVGHGG